MNIDDRLRAALKREPAPRDFAASVMARAKAEEPVVPFWRRPLILVLAAALLLAAVIPPSVQEYRRRQQERALEAKARLLTALTITQTQLRRVSARIQRNSRRPL
jgi:negative regulator of sigma E activity